MSFDHLSTVLSALGPGLKNHLWQSTAFSAVAALLALGMRKNYARIRYWIWLTASVKFLIPFSALVGIGGLVVPQRDPAPSVVAVYDLMDVVGQPFTSAPEASSPVDTPLPRFRHGLPAGFSLPVPIALVWGLGTFSILTVWGIYWRRVKRAIHSATSAVDGPELQALRELERTVPFKTPVRLCLTDSNLGPGVYGITHCTLIWPFSNFTPLRSRAN